MNCRSLVLEPLPYISNKCYLIKYLLTGPVVIFNVDLFVEAGELLGLLDDRVGSVVR